MIGPVAQVALTILFGALAGGITNSVAIWMLFHPYDPPRLFGRRIRILQGAIPKNKARLAAAIGNAVGTRLLTPDDLAQTLTDPRFRDAFDERLGHLIESFLIEPRGPLTESLPPALVDELRDLLDGVAARLLTRLDSYLASDEFLSTAQGWAERLADELADRPIGELLTPEREEALTTAAERWITDAVERPGLEEAINDYLDRLAVRVLAPGQTFQDLLPEGLVATVERAIAGYLPLALERLGGLLEDQETRALVQRVLGEILERFMSDLKFHQRLVASLLIRPETIDKVLKAVEAEGAGKISEILHEPASRDAMARGVNDAVVDLLRRPVDSVLGRPGDANVEEAKGTVTGWVTKLIREPQTRTFLVDRLKVLLRSVEGRTWGDLFRHLPPERIAELISMVASSERASALYREATDQIIRGVLERPIGRLADHLPDDAPDRITTAIADPIWNWLQDQVPEVARRIDIARQVETKILDFPMTRVEELIRGVTERELHLIVRLGYLLGAVIGTISAVINLVLR